MMNKYKLDGGIDAKQSSELSLTLVNQSRYYWGSPSAPSMSLAALYAVAVLASKMHHILWAGDTSPTEPIQH